MKIYDYQNQNLINSTLLIVGFFLILLGLFCFFILSKYKPEAKEDFSAKLFGLTKSQINEKTSSFSKISKMMGIMLFLAAGLWMYFQLKDYFYVRNIYHFENIQTITGRLDSIGRTNLSSSDYITLHLNNKSFCIVHDSRYVANRNLLRHDSIMIEYFEKSGKSMDLEVVKIELK